jgi:hypothetical protein
MGKAQVKMTVNGQAVEGLVEPRTLLIHFLREELRLTGPHIGCDTSHCGACTIDLNGKSVKSCTVFAVQAALATECGYIAMVGSRKKAQALKDGLREPGVADETVARLKAPAGLDIGAIEPEEIAVSIMGEIVQVRRQAIRQPADASGTVVAGRINVTS